MKPSAFLNLPGLAVGSGTVLLLGLGILLGSRNLRNYDPALLIYTFGALFAAFAVAYRYAVWLQRPPTRVYWRRGWQLVCQGGSCGRTSSRCCMLSVAISPPSISYAVVVSAVGSPISVSPGAQ